MREQRHREITRNYTYYYSSKRRGHLGFVAPRVHKRNCRHDARGLGLTGTPPRPAEGRAKISYASWAASAAQRSSRVRTEAGGVASNLCHWME